MLTVLSGDQDWWGLVSLLFTHSFSCFLCKCWTASPSVRLCCVSGPRMAGAPLPAQGIQRRQLEGREHLEDFLEEVA